MVVAKKVICLVVGFILMTLMIGGCSYMNDKPVNTLDKYPTKPVTFIVPYAAGGSSDILARAMEKSAIKHLGQPLVVTNIPGGAATIGWNELAGAKPDGYTVGIVPIGAILQPLYGPTRYHYPSALEPLVQVTSSPVVVAVRSDQPWENIGDLVSYAKRHPSEIKYANPGLGSSPNVTGEIFAKEAGIKLDQVPFRGDAEAAAALLGGHVQLTFVNLPAIKEYVKVGRVKILAVATEIRLTEPLLKNVPTFKEQGFNVVYNIWQGIGAPKGLPADEKARLVAGLSEIINDPEFIKNMEDLGMEVDYLGPQEFSQKWIDETARLTKIVQETGIAERIAAQKK